MKSILAQTLVFSVLLAACTLAGPERPAASGPSRDDIQPTATAVAALPAAPTSPEASSGRGDAPLFLTSMTHMERGFDDDREEPVFDLHVDQLTYGLDLADEYGALLTIESEKPFAIASTTWGRNFMAEIVARGHGVGTHCDFGFRSERMPAEQYARFFAENKALVDALVGAENNLGCSGGGGVNDWARAASLAGFKYLDGIVGMHYLAMPLENRPDSSWTDDFINTLGYHFPAPVDLDQRIYPFLVVDASDFDPDPEGTLLVSSGELGSLAMLAEGVYGDAPLTVEDVDALVALIRQVDRDRDRSRIAKLTVYLPVNTFQPGNESLLRYFFQLMRDLSDQGLITWATQLQVYEAYIAWNK